MRKSTQIEQSKQLKENNHEGVTEPRTIIRHVLVIVTAADRPFRLVMQNRHALAVAVEVHNGFDLVEFGGNYPTQKDAEVAGHIAYRMLHLANFKTPVTPIQTDYMTDDELLVGLGLQHHP